MIKELSKDTYKQVFADTKGSIIELYAPWCGVCKQVEPILQALEKEFGSSYNFYKADIDKIPELVQTYKVTSTPTLLFIKHGQLQDKYVGYIAKEDIIEKMQAAFLEST